MPPPHLTGLSTSVAIPSVSILLVIGILVLAHLTRRLSLASAVAFIIVTASTILVMAIGNSFTTLCLSLAATLDILASCVPVFGNFYVVRIATLLLGASMSGHALDRQG